jgi:nicotinate dehydrogenase subunit B
MIYTENQNSEIPSPGLKRRDFFKLLGGGLYIFFNLGESLDTFATEAEQRRSLPTDYNAFLRVAEDGTVTCYTGKIEMGQGIITSLAQMMADELDVEFEKVKMVMGDTDLCPYDAGTWGSMTTRAFGPSMLAAAAEARAVLLTLGADYLKTTPDRLTVNKGIIYVKDKKRKKVSYGQLTKGQKIGKFLEEKPKPKDFAAFKIKGKSFNHVDAISKVKGEALYTGDFRMPGMVYAKILRPPSHGATLVSADTSEAEKTEGVLLVRDKDLIAVLHQDIEKAEMALSKIKAEYSFKEMDFDDKTVFHHMLQFKSDALKTAATFLWEKENRILYLKVSFITVMLAMPPSSPILLWPGLKGIN